MKSSSILGEKYIEPILNIARQNLETTGYLETMVFAKLTSNKVMPVGMMDLPASLNAKQMLMNILGDKLREDGSDIMEAVVLTESWYTDAIKNQAALKYPPSQHPGGQEAIAIIGRNAENTRNTTVIQPYTYNANNYPVWEKISVADYNQPADESSVQAVGLLDYLFDPRAMD